MNDQTMQFTRADIGRIGSDERGVRFVVMKPGVEQGTEPEDDPHYVLLLPGRMLRGEHGIYMPGSSMHASRLHGAITWETT